jgi:hypothetical protein
VKAVLYQFDPNTGKHDKLTLAENAHTLSVEGDIVSVETFGNEVVATVRLSERD